MKFKRIFLIVLDSFGIGAAKDAADYGDEGADTLKTVSKSGEFNLRNMAKLGLFNIDDANGGAPFPAPAGAYGRLYERSKGKDTTTGHWEIAGIISGEPFPTYPGGFPEDIINEFERKTGRGILCNKPYSGTEVIKDYGREHIKTGKLIVYTSADSVFQIAAHEEIVPRERLYEYCRKARSILTGKNAVARVIARPFSGEYPNFARTGGRHDFSLEPPEKTMLDILKEEGMDVLGIGKIYDIFAGRGLTDYVFTKDNKEGINEILKAEEKEFTGLCFANLVDFDMKYGHRNDIDGYARALAYFDHALESIIKKLTFDDVLIITADHGCDPGFAGTDHTRENVPLLIFSEKIKSVNLGTINGFSCVGRTVLDLLGVKNEIDGESFLHKIV